MTALAKAIRKRNRQTRPYYPGEPPPTTNPQLSNSKKKKKIWS
jgi:hypothetical protein